MLYLARGVDKLARKNKLVINWYSFLGQEYSCFNVIVSRLVTLMILKAKNKKICPLTPQKGSTPDPKAQLRLLCNCSFPCKTQSSTPERTLVKVLG